MYVSINMQEEQAEGVGYHPILYVSQFKILNNLTLKNDTVDGKLEELIIYKFEDRETTEPVMFG